MHEIGYVIGHAVGVILKFAIPVGAVLLVVWLIKRGKKK